MEKYIKESIENEIISRLDNREKVYIESGAAVDIIISYSVRKYKTHEWQKYQEREITFSTSACIFPNKINLHDWDNIDTEEYEGKLFVHVW